MSEFLCSRFPSQFSHYWSIKCSSQAECVHSVETQADINRSSVGFCTWRTCLLLSYHLQLPFGHCVLGTMGYLCVAAAPWTTGGVWRPGWILPPIDWRSENECLQLPWDFTQSSCELPILCVTAASLIPELFPVSRRNKQDLLHGVNGQ